MKTSLRGLISSLIARIDDMLDVFSEKEEEQPKEKAKQPRAISMSMLPALLPELDVVFTLKRIQKADTHTLGEFYFDDMHLCYSLENPWKDNERRLSCIPEGTYTCKRRKSPRFGDTFEVQDVEGRDHILFHVGNTAEDTHGCILLGSKVGVLEGKRAVLNSRQTFNNFRRILAKIDEFTLIIETEKVSEPKVVDV